MEGWIKLHRKIKDWEWYNDSQTLHLFIHLLLSANSKNKNWHGIEVKRGQVIVGRRKLSKLTGISERSVRTSLKRLKSTHELTIKTTNKYSIITICNYESYQMTKSESDQQSDPQSDQQVTTTKEYKKKEEEEKEKEKEKEKPPEEEITSTPSRRIQSYTDIFNTFFDAYTKITKMGDDKEPAYREWRLLSQEDRIKAMKSVRDYYEDCLKQKRLPKMAKTYLRDKTFNNDYSRSSRFHPDGRVKLVI